MLEIAAGTGRNLRHYPPGVRLTTIELSPGMLEHVRSPLRAIRVGERLLEPIMLRFEHDHLLREPLDHLQAEGFEIERVERFKLGIVERVTARKPAVA